MSSEQASWTELWGVTQGVHWQNVDLRETMIKVSIHILSPYHHERCVTSCSERLSMASSAVRLFTESHQLQFPAVREAAHQSIMLDQASGIQPLPAALALQARLVVYLRSPNQPSSISTTTSSP